MADVRTPLQGTVVRVEVAPGATVEATSPLVVVESMKMEHVVQAGVAGTVGRLAVAAGDAVQRGDLLAVVTPVERPPLPAPAERRSPPRGGSSASTAAPPASRRPVVGRANRMPHPPAVGTRAPPGPRCGARTLTMGVAAWRATARPAAE